MKDLPNQRKRKEGISLKPVPTLKKATYPAAMGLMRRESRQTITERGGKETTKTGHGAVTRTPNPDVDRSGNSGDSRGWHGGGGNCPPRFWPCPWFPPPPTTFFNGILNMIVVSNFHILNIIWPCYSFANTHKE